MSSSLFLHPLFRGLVGDAELEKLFSPSAEVAAMLDFEAALAEAQAAHDEISAEAATAITEAVRAYKPDAEALTEGARRDGFIVPALVAGLREALPEEHRASLHKGTTSQDLIDTSLAKRLGMVFDLFEGRLAALDEQFAAIGAQAGGREIMGVTRMRDALPVQLEHRLSLWRRPLAEARIRAAGLRKLICVLHLVGPVGDKRGIGRDPIGIANHMAQALELGFDPMRRHSNRAWIADTGHWLALISGALGKLGQDIVLMAQDSVASVTLKEGGSSSAMEHKTNPVAAETLIALARFNAVQVSGLQQAQVHEMERSGAAWTLEWMILPQMAAATGAGLLLAKHVLETTDFTAE